MQTAKWRKNKILPTIGISTLGCPKNLVDTENIAGILHGAGYPITADHSKADISLVNTCTFIEESTNESQEILTELSKQEQKLIITGCMAQRFKEDLFNKFPNTQAIVGTGNISDILKVIKKVTVNLNNDKSLQIVKVDEIPMAVADSSTPRLNTQIGPSAYLKIAEGCAHRCAFCIIPYLRGNTRSRTIEDIVTEAKRLVKSGVKEIVLVSQDSTAYGTDIYKRRALADLLREVADKSNATWVRLMYAYPGETDEEILDVIAKKTNIVKYIDIPLQHASARILKSMRRPSAVKDTIKLIRKKLPNGTIRTTFVVGFPDETKEDFNELYNFIKETRFDRVGVFTYSKEKGTPAFDFENQVPGEIKQERRDKLMKLQQQISLEKNQSFIGKEMDMLVEYLKYDVKAIHELPQRKKHHGTPKRVVGRSFRDAPEIDGQLYIDLKSNDTTPMPGEFIKVKIVDCDEYDLFCKL
ncbi:MAG: ribosomal protein S12 methylthiotransferase RimO [Candidatus Melainabacteria bacterium RIFCSPLOWO2_02_FULL_35_15]|nr:MAG: ribosomal protein S12 methylthiotransferase RimO [Candidatus Melainabacteria bacterium RIFCSPLOWO2_02_FULL_35_15]